MTDFTDSRTAGVLHRNALALARERQRVAAWVRDVHDRHAALSAGREIGLDDYLRDLYRGPYRTQGQPEGQP